MKRRSVTITTQQPPTVELDSEARAAYVRFSNRKVAETRPVTTEGCIVTIDFDSDGAVIGVELVGVHEFGVEPLLELAGIPPIPKKLSDERGTFRPIYKRPNLRTVAPHSVTGSISSQTQMRQQEIQPTVQLELKPLSQEGIPAALEKAFRYRMLNEPLEAQSICLDVLGVDPDNQQALVTLLLAITDRFAEGEIAGVARAEELLPRFKSEYDRAYYKGIILERRAKAHLHRGLVDAGYNVYEWLHEAMTHFARAEATRPPGNDDALLRWNACARLIEREKLCSRPAEDFEPSLE